MADTDTKVEEEEMKVIEVETKDNLEEKQSNIVPISSIIPANYNPKIRGSVAETVEIPKYNQNRRLSQLEMKEMKEQIDSMQEALIENPEKAARRFTIEQEDRREKSVFHTKPDLSPLDAKTVVAGLGPVIFCCVLVIFGVIVYAVANKPNNNIYDAMAWGDWPNWGGNLQNQQQAAAGSLINSSNVENNLQFKCDYTQTSRGGARGFIATDKYSKNGYFVDSSGYVTSISLFDCSLNWKTRISDALGLELGLGYNVESRNGVALYRDIKGRKGVLIGTPYAVNDGIQSEKCYVLSLNQANGNKIFAIELEANGAPYCAMDGFIVESRFAYGGIWTSSTCDEEVDNEQCTYRGEVIKIDLNSHKVVQRWYSLPEVTNLNEYYFGAAPKNYPSIIGDYLVIGTGSLFGNPQPVDYCLSGDIDKITGAITTNACGEDRSNVTAWKCFEDEVYSDAVSILNKTTFDHIASAALSGNDKSTDSCNLFNIDTLDEALCGEKSTIGPGADITAQATFTRSGIQHAAVLTKAGMFWVFSLPSLEVNMAKKVGPSGGSYSLAIDTTNNIAIVSITGADTNAKYEMMDDTAVCGTGFVEAVDLETGDTLWQLVNPYGIIGDECDAVADDYDAVDWSLIRDNEQCIVGLPAITNVVTNVVIPDIEGVRVPFDANERATFIAPVTISNDLVFIPSNTGDVFVSDILSGEVVRRLSCANEDASAWGQSGLNRAGISAGVTVVRDVAILYCGSLESELDSTSGNKVQLYQLA